MTDMDVVGAKYRNSLAILVQATQGIAALRTTFPSPVVRTPVPVTVTVKMFWILVLRPHTTLSHSLYLAVIDAYTLTRWHTQEAIGMYCTNMDELCTNIPRAENVWWMDCLSCPAVHVDGCQVRYSTAQPSPAEFVGIMATTPRDEDPSKNKQTLMHATAPTLRGAVSTARTSHNV